MKTWKDIAAAQQAKRQNRIPKEWLLKNPPADDVYNVMDIPYTCGIMSPEELKITEKDCVELLDLMANKKLKSYDVTLAFCKRAAIAQQLTNCLTSIFFEEGLAMAKELDETLERTGEIVGPLHGLPISLKEMYDLKGKDNCIGFIASVDSLAQEDEYIIHLLRKAGCVFFVKTNVPQTLMHLETYNNVYGRTLNPYNRRLSPGGSSGGESALVGFRGSPIGLASDGGGSIRCPAAFMGLYGLKPTSGRIPLNEAKLAMPGYDSTPASAGPVCRSLRDNELFIKVMLDAQPWLVQPGLVPIPWRPVELTNVKIGVSFDDGICRPHPPIKRAIEYVSKRLSGISGISVSEYVPYKHAEGYDLIRRLYYTDGGEMNKKQMATSGEPMLPMSAWIMKSSHTKTATMEDLWAMNVQREKYRKEYLGHWMNSAFDVVLCAVAPVAAFRHDMSKCWSYTAIWNLLDYPAISFPSGLHCDPERDLKYTDYTPRNNEFDAWNLSTYEPKLYADAPIALQLVGKKYDDEKVVAALHLIKNILDI